MFDTSELDNILDDPSMESKKFEPELVDLRQPVMAQPKEIPIEDSNLVDVNVGDLEFNEITSTIVDKEIIALDSTSMNLGNITDGLVGTFRISIVTKKPNNNTQFLERYGPRVFAITNQNRDELYKNFYTSVYLQSPTGSLAPENFKMLDRIRNLYERHIQLKVIQNSKNKIILLDGSLIGDTIANPRKFIDDMISDSYKNNNILVAISKFTNLTLKSNRRSILSLLDFKKESTFIGPLNNKIEQQGYRYAGNIYVAKMSNLGIPFRIDLPKSVTDVKQVFDMLSGMSRYYGYPEELKFAHSTCIHSSLEILALQAYAIGKYHMQIEENLRNLIFAPFTTG